MENQDAVLAAFQAFGSPDRPVGLGKLELELEQEHNRQVAEEDYCSFCNKDALSLLDGNYACTECGTVNTRFLDMSAEWRYYGIEDSRATDPSRCGMPTNDLLPDSSFGSTIGYSHNEPFQMRLLRRYHMWNAMTYKERSLYNIFDSLTTQSVSHGIPKSIIEQAKVYYKRLSEMKISRGENRHGLIASSIYYACKTNRVARSAKEIAKIFNIKQSTMTRGCKRFQELLHMDMEESHAEDFVGRFCSTLGMPRPCSDACKCVIEKVAELDILSSSTPPSMAACCILLCSNEREWGYSKADVCAACDVSQVTVTKYMKLLKPYSFLGKS